MLMVADFGSGGLRYGDFGRMVLSQSTSQEIPSNPNILQGWIKGMSAREILEYMNEKEYKKLMG